MELDDSDPPLGQGFEAAGLDEQDAESEEESEPEDAELENTAAPGRRQRAAQAGSSYKVHDGRKWHGVF